MKNREGKILGLINARGGSKGIPRKNIKKLLGKPLIAYSIEAALNSSNVDHLVVSTDDFEIAEIAKKYGASVPFIRPEELSTDKIPQMGAVIHAIHYLERNQNELYDIIVLLQPTSPLRNSNDIDTSIEKLLKGKKDSVISFTRVEQGHPYNMYTSQKGKPERLIGIPGIRMQRQNYPEIYLRNGAIYAAKKEHVLKEKSFYSDNCGMYIMPFDRSVTIDEPFDWEFAEFLLERSKKKYGK